MTTPILDAGQLYCLPRLDRLYRQLRFRHHPALVDTQLVESILDVYGMQARGVGTVPGVPGRSQNLILVTDAGKKMLKRYKRTVDAAAVHHEHTILRYLAEIDFPAPRLNHTTRNETLVRREGYSYALFDVIEGYFQYHNYLFTPTQTGEFIRASGQALGALHQALRDYTPEGSNHNGFVSHTGKRWREIGWFISQLEQCDQASQQAGPAANHPLRHALSQHAEWIKERLHKLDTLLASAAPTRLIIHGDYGPYNLFFKRGAPVIVLDFELARLDWRLTDLATALPSFAHSRLGFNWNRMRWFVDAYRSRCGVDNAELSLLPAVWQFLSLRRVIVCWSRFSETGEPRWMQEARHKLALANWLGKNESKIARSLAR